MCEAVALFESELPVELVEGHGLSRRVHRRGDGEREVRFFYRDREPLLPVWYEGSLQLLRWGQRNRRGRLPPTGWTWKATVEAGGWGPFSAEPVHILANFGLEYGIWFGIARGIRGVVVRDEHEEPVVYMMVETATRYFRVMTRSERMPVLIGEVI